ncbi:MAG: class I SAM-dependent methyltransferase [Elusimicrobia bacterium]|nr:class I SAM-dependent methyltransferase [Elusimicrobiota bacterium]
MRGIIDIYRKIVKKIIKKTFYLWEFFGFHITPVHYYEPVPNTRELNDELWDVLSELPGIDINDQRQVELLTMFSSKYAVEYNSLPAEKTLINYEYYVNNKSFGSVEGEILYSMIRHFRPRKIYEIGSGFSTMLSAQALLENEKEDGHKTELIAFDPFPNDIIKKGFPGLSKLETKRIQDVDWAFFKTLNESDILFIDSSHVLKIGSDVKYEYLELLPRLNKGVIIHCHDIFLPAEYLKTWVMKDGYFWTEQYLLQAFLAFNDTFRILWAASYMHLNHPDLLKEAFNSYSEKEWPSSFWLKKIK